jgi:hypothetical protein
MFTVSELQTIKEALYATQFPYEIDLIAKITQTQRDLIITMVKESA